MPLRVGNLVAELSLDPRRFNQGLRQVGTQMEALGRRVTTLGYSLSRLSAPLAIATGGAVKMATTFDTEMTKVETLVGIARSQVDAWRRDLLDLAPVVGRTPAELARGLYFVTSAGERGAQALDVLTKSAQAAAVGLGETQVIANAVTSAMRAYHKEGMTAARATDILLNTVRLGKVEADALAGSLGRVLGIAAQVGVSFEDVGAFMATFTRLGVGAEEAATALRGTLAILLKSGDQAKDAMASLGIPIDELRQMVRGPGGLVQALIALFDAVGANEDAIGLIFPRLRAIAGVLGVVQAQGEDYARIADQMRRETGLLSEAFTRWEQTPAAKFRKALGALTAAAVEFGTVALPAVTSVVQGLSSLVRQFRELEPWQKKAVMAFAAIGAVAGPLLIVVGQLAIAIGIAGGALLTIATVGAPAIAAIAAIGVAAYQLIRNWDALALETRLAWQDVKAGVAWGVEGAILAIDNALDKIQEFVGAMAALPAAVFPLKGAFQAADAAIAGLRTASDDALASLRAMQVGMEDARNVILKTADAKDEIRALGKSMGWSAARTQVWIDTLRGLERQALAGAIDPAAFKGKVDELLGQLVGLQKEFFKAGQALGEATAAGLADATEGTALPQAVQDILSAFRTELRQLPTRLEALGPELFDLADEAAQAYRKTIDALITEGVGLDDVLDDQGTTLRTLSARYVALVGAIEQLRAKQEQIQAVLDEATAAAQRYGLSLQEAAMRAGDATQSMGSTIIGGLEDINKEVGRIAAMMGQQLIMGIIQGVQDWGDFFKRILATILTALLNAAFKAAHIIGSPSPLARKAARWVPLGMIEGIKDTLPQLERTILQTRSLLAAGVGGTPSLAVPAVHAPSMAQGLAVTPSGQHITIQLPTMPEPLTPEAQAVNARWQRVIAETNRALKSRGFRFED